MVYGFAFLHITCLNLPDGMAIANEMEGGVETAQEGGIETAQEGDYYCIRTE